MLKYGPIISPNNFKSNRNLSRKSNQQNSIILSNISGTSSSSGTGGLLESANITEINTKSINSINDSASPYIVFSGAVTFSINKNQYIDNNFDLYEEINVLKNFSTPIKYKIFSFYKLSK